MKKFISFGLFALGLLLMSVAPSIETQEEFGKYPLITGSCDNGFEYEYYDINYSNDDHEDIVDEICSDPQNQEITDAD